MTFPKNIYHCRKIFLTLPKIFAGGPLRWEGRGRGVVRVAADQGAADGEQEGAGGEDRAGREAAGGHEGHRNI